MIYANGSVFGGKWQGDLKSDGVLIDVSNNWTCGTWDGLVPLKAVTKMKIAREKCLYFGEVCQGQRYLPASLQCSFGVL
jgi:hypothetical protein